MTTIAELMELAEIPVLEGYILPKLRPRRKRKAASKAIGADLEDIEEEEGERKRLLDRIFKSDEPSDGSQPPQEPQPPLDPLQPIAGVNTAYAPRVVPPPTHLQMDEATRARVYGRKDNEPRQENALTVRCHRCEAPMRVCIRKLKYSDHIKEYPSFRCTRKGCQTFKSMRIVDEPALARVARIKRTPPKKKGGKKGQTPAADEDGDGEQTDEHEAEEEEQTETTPGDVPNPYVGVRRKKKKNEAVATTPTSESSAPSAHLAPIPPPAMRSLGPVVSTGGLTVPTGTTGPAPTIPPLNHLMYPSMMTTRSHSRGAASLQQLLLPGRLSTPHRPAISFRLPPTPMSTSSSSKTRTSSEVYPALAQAQPRRRSRYDTCTQEQKEAVAALLRKYDEDLQREGVGGRRDYYSAFGGWEEQRGVREAVEGPSRMEDGGSEDTAGLMSSSFESAKEASSPHLSAKSAAAIYEELVNAALAAAAAPKAAPPPPPPVTMQPLVLPVSTQQQSAPICITLSATPSPTPQLSHAAAAAADNVPAAPTTPEEDEKKQEEPEQPAALPPLPPPPVMRTLRPMESPVPRSAAAYSTQQLQLQQQQSMQSMLQPLSPLDLRSFQLPRMQQHVLPLQQQLLQQVTASAPTAAPPLRALSPYETLALEQIASAARTLAAINVMTRTATTPPFGFGTSLVSSGYGGAQQSSSSSMQQQMQQLQAQFAPTTMPDCGAQPMLQQQQLQYLQQLSPMLPAQWNFFGDEEQPRDSPTPYGGLHADTFDNASVMILEDDDSGIADQSNRDDTPSEQYDEYDSHEYDAEFAMELRQHNM